MGLFSKRTKKKTYDRSNQKPIIKASICNGEQVAGFKDLKTGKFQEVCLIKSRGKTLRHLRRCMGLRERLRRNTEEPRFK